MKRPRPSQPPLPRDSSGASPADIDALYGLEPIFEPVREPGHTVEAAAFHSIQCPWCGERFDMLVDTGAGAVTYIEDCQICCHPIEFELQTEPGGAFAGLSVRRS